MCRELRYFVDAPKGAPRYWNWPAPFCVLSLMAYNIHYCLRCLKRDMYDMTGVPEARLKESSKPGKLELLKVQLYAMSRMDPAVNRWSRMDPDVAFC